MTGIRISGMSSGLPPNIVDQIIDAERIPIKQMESKKTTHDEKYKLVQELETKVLEVPKSMAEMINLRGFTNSKLTSGDPNIINGVVDPNEAGTGTWTVEVLQLAQKPSSISSGFPDPNKSEIGVGYLKFKTNEGIKEIYISGKNSTLNGVASAINSASVGLRASVLNDRKDKENPYKLIVSGLATGDDNQIEFPTVYLLDGDQDFYFDVSKPAENAKIKVDGIEMEVAENKVKDVIPGVTLDLKQASPGHPISVTIKEDVEAISGKIKQFVDAYNGVLSWIQNQHKITKGKDGRERMGPMGGDGILRSLENDLRRTILNPQYGVPSKIERLSELGVEFNRNGTLDLKQDKFNKVLANDPQSVAGFLRGDGFSIGFIPTVKRQINIITNGQNGPLSMRKKSLQQTIKHYDERIENKTKQLEKKEDQIRQKFANLETQMSKLNQQGSAIAGALANKGS